MTKRYLPIGERFWPKVDRNGDSGCWIWRDAPDSKGYGRLKVSRMMKMAHRVAYELIVGPIPHGMELDHLCRNTLCVNPSHLEPVTHKENLLRGLGVGSENAAKTQCVHGHAFDAINTYSIATGVNGRRRQCRACNAIAVAKYKSRKAAA